MYDANEKITLELSLDEAFALSDAATCLWLVGRGDIDVAADAYRIQGDDNDYSANQVEVMNRLAQRVDEALKATSFHRAIKAMCRQLRNERARRSHGNGQPSP